jgi:K+-sensing histidine kinase KdpD
VSTLVPKIKLRNARAWAPRTPLRWFVAFAAFLAALALRLLLHDTFGARYPLIFFTMATLMVHFFLGLAPALAVALVSLPVGAFLFVPPYNTFGIPDNDDLFLIAYYVGSTALLMVLIQYLRRALYQSVLLAEVAESRYLMLLDSEADRDAAELEIRERQP